MNKNEEVIDVYSPENVREHGDSALGVDDHKLLLGTVLEKMLVLPRLLRLAFKQMTLERAEAGLDESPVQFGIGGPPVLMLLSREGPLRAGALAERGHMPEPVVSRVLKNLEQAGLVERNTDPDNRRVVWVSLTDKGRILTERLQASISANLSEILGPLSNRDLEEMIATFTNLEHLVAAAEQRAAQAGNSRQPNTQETSNVTGNI